MSHQTILWIIFGFVVLGVLALDLGLLQRKARAVKLKGALVWSTAWTVLALLFAAGIYFWLDLVNPTYSHAKAMEYLTGYIIERSLSMDNLFVFLLIFSYFKVAKVYQYRVLFWGILSALVIRGVFIGVGVAAIRHFEWVVLFFGVLLVFSGIRMAWHKDEEIHPEKNIVLRIFRKIMPVTKDDESGHFLVRRGGRIFATPLLVVLIVVETSDIIFAVDSIPAVLAITTDPFIVYTSNIFAILGLRALYFALAGFMEIFHFLHYGLSLILVFVGAKMLLAYFGWKIPTVAALGVIAAILALSVLASVVWPHREKKAQK